MTRVFWCVFMPAFLQSLNVRDHQLLDVGEDIFLQFVFVVFTLLEQHF